MSLLVFIEDVSRAERDVTRLTANGKAKIQENFKKRYTSDTAQTILNTSTWLNPRYKTEYLSEEDAQNAAENIKKMIFEFEQPNKRSSENREDTDNPTPWTSQMTRRNQKQRKKEHLIWKCLGI